MKSPSLPDLKPRTATVSLRGHELRVRALELDHILDLMVRFPEVAEALDRGEVARALLASGPEAKAAVIDAAMRWEPGTATSLELGAIEQASIIIAAVDMTIPEAPEGEDPVGKVRAQLTALANRIGRTAPEAGPSSSNA